MHDSGIDLYKYVVTKNRLVVRPLSVLARLMRSKRCTNSFDVNREWIFKAPIHINNVLLSSYEPKNLATVIYGNYNRLHDFPGADITLKIERKFTKLYSLSIISKMLRFSLKVPSKMMEMVLEEEASLDVLTKVLKDYRGKKIYFYNYYGPFGQALIKVAAAYGIQTIELQHGSISNLHKCYTTNMGQVLPSKFRAWNEYSMNLVESRLNVDVELASKIFNVENGTKILLTLGSDLDNVDEFIFSLAKMYSLKVRPHPRHEWVYEGPSIDFEVCPHSESIIDSLNGVRLHITKTSGSFFQAIDCRVPTVLIDEKSKDWYEQFKESNLVYYAPNNWLEAVNKIMSHKENHNFE